MTTAPATDRQVSYLTALLRRVAADGMTPTLTHAANAIAAAGPLTKAEASAAISDAKAVLDAAPAPAAKRTAVPEGFYLAGGDVARVVPTKDGQRTYAKRLDPRTGRWEYVGGLVSRLTEDDALTVGEAAERGRHWGRCMFCGLELSDADSVARGIGPICWDKYAKGR
jgi:hypothetical protein